MNEDQLALSHFGGTVRLFPLPNLVFFPHVIQPLHIFEPRYRHMMADALLSDRLLALVLLKPGWEQSYEDRPAIYSVACVGRIAAEQMLPDGRYNLLLRGLQRVRILEEIPDGKPYRSARAELMPDDEISSIEYVIELRRRLAESVLPRFPETGGAREQLAELFRGEMPLGALCDILAFALPLPLESKQRLLEETTIEHRAELLLEILGQPPKPQPTIVVARPRKFPPDFSLN